MAEGIRAALPHHEQRIALGIDQVDAQPAERLQLRALDRAAELVLVGLGATGQPFPQGDGDTLRVGVQPSQRGIVELVLERDPLRLGPRDVAARQSEPTRGARTVAATTSTTAAIATSPRFISSPPEG